MKKFFRVFWSLVLLIPVNASAEIEYITPGHLSHHVYFNNMSEAKAGCEQAIISHSAMKLGTSEPMPITAIIGHACPTWKPNSCLYQAGWFKDGNDGTLHLYTCYFPMYRLVPPQPKIGCHVGGNPIDLETGAKIQNVTDGIVAGVEFKRYYSSILVSRDGAMGLGWRHSFDVKLDNIGPEPRMNTGYLHLQWSNQNSVSGLTPEMACAGWASLKGQYMGGALSQASSRFLDKSSCEIIDSNGAIVAVFPIVPATGFRVFDSDVEQPEKSHTISMPDGTNYYFQKNGNSYQEVYGRAVTLSVSATEVSFVAPDMARYIFHNHLLHSVIYKNGKTIFVQRDGENRIASLVADGVTITFEYTPYNQIGTVQLGLGEALTYAYDNGRLISVSDGTGIRFEYHYENTNFNHLLTGISDAEGNRYATWKYDPQGRAYLSEHGDQREEFTIDYANFNHFNAPTLKATNALGKGTTYRYAFVNGVRRVAAVEGHASANCAAANKSYDYYPNGTLKSKTDWSGNITMYERDDFGREISRTEASGTPQARTVLTEYHPALNQPVKITEPGLITEMTYDTAGRLLNTKKIATAQ
jgi:hypothetical protein